MDVIFGLSPVMFWLALAVVFGVIEAITLGVTSIWFVFGSLAAMLMAGLGFGMPIQIAVFLIVSIILLFLTRPIFVKKFKLGSEKTNVDAVIGQVGVVKQDIDNISGKGQVVIKGQVWSARSADESIMRKGERVQVERIEGVRVIVRRLYPNQANNQMNGQMQNGMQNGRGF